MCSWVPNNNKYIVGAHLIEMIMQIFMLNESRISCETTKRSKKKKKNTKELREKIKINHLLRGGDEW